MTSRFNRPLGMVAAAAILGAALIVAPSLSSAQTGAPAPAAAPAPSAHAAQVERHNAPAAVEKRITELHQKLHITPSEETAWNSVAQAMRDSAEKMDGLVRTREQGENSMNAVQDLQSYQQIAQAHVDSLKTLVSSFQSLYDEMSPTQQKTADAVFGHTQKRASTTSKGG